MSKKKKGPIIKKGLDEWMATYSDLVTLLFCFFVLLYASSSSDPVRFQYIFQAFKSGGDYINTVISQQPDYVTEGDSENNSETPPINEGEGSGVINQSGDGDIENTFEGLFNMLSEAAASSDAAASISVEGNAGEIRLSIGGDVLFNPDSWELTNAGRSVLSGLVPSIKAVQDYIASVVVQGHTADIGKGSASGVNDWTLSSLRASSVVEYMDFVRMVDSEKLKTEGYAQYRPIAENDTAAGMAQNRRVEIIIKRNEYRVGDTDVMKDILLYDYYQKVNDLDGNDQPIEPDAPTEEDGTQNIIDWLNDKYREQEDTDTTGGADVGVSAGGNPGSISDDDYYELDAEGNPIIEEAQTEAAAAETEAATDN